MLANQHISNTENIFSFKKSIVSNYTFFDGKSEFEVVNNYSDWLSSTDYLDYSKSFVNIVNTKIHLFGESRKALNSSNFNRSVLMRLAHLFDLKSEVTDKECKIYHEKYRYDNYYLVSELFNKEYYIIIYAIGGSRFPESITLHGLLKFNPPSKKAFFSTKNFISKFFRSILFLILFCSIGLSIDIIFSLIRNKEITKISLALSPGLPLILWIYYLLTGKFNKE